MYGYERLSCKSPNDALELRARAAFHSAQGLNGFRDRRLWLHSTFIRCFREEDPSPVAGGKPPARRTKRPAAPLVVHSSYH
jgi:hypothetical protein